MTEYINREEVIEKLMGIRVEPDDFTFNFANGYNAGVINAVTEMRLAPAADVVERTKPVTNADRIRAMSDEELAEKLTWIVPYCGDCPARVGNGEECLKDCEKAWLDWLRQEAE